MLEYLPVVRARSGVFVTLFHALKSAGVPVTLRENTQSTRAMRQLIGNRMYRLTLPAGDATVSAVMVDAAPQP